MILVHRCIKCGAEFEGTDLIILNGCPECGSKFFEYSHQGKVKGIKKSNEGSVETIMVKEHGVYEVNLSSLMEDDSVIISDEEGKYLIDINFLLKKRLREKNNSKG